MRRAFLAVFLLAFGLFLTTTSQGCADIGVGDPCTPEQEYDPSFIGFDEKEVNVESKSFQCRTRICLVNHFRGRTSCPYGQNAEGKAFTPDSRNCRVPGTQVPIDGLTTSDPNSFRDPRKKALVPPSCVDRAGDKAVYCSCRCADINGDKPSDQTFCDCPESFSCVALVTSIGKGNEGLTGSYCIKSGTKYNKDTACTVGDCLAADKKCGADPP